MNEQHRAPVSEPMRVILGTDGSDPARVGVDLVAGAAWPHGTEVVIVEAIEPEVALVGGTWPAAAIVATERLQTAVVAEAERIVQEAKVRLERDDLHVEVVVVHGRAATTLAEQARRRASDLIVVGSRGHGTIESMLLGSVSAELIAHAPSPVLVARKPRIERVLLAWDGSACAAAAAERLITWPILAQASARVVGVADVAVPWWSGAPASGTPELVAAYAETADYSKARYEELTNQMAARLRAAGVAADTEVRRGDPATEIIAAARDVEADAIVMGTHGRTGLARLVLGSVARNVVLHAPCSVLVVRAPTAPAGEGSTATAASAPGG